MSEPGDVARHPIKVSVSIIWQDNLGRRKEFVFTGDSVEMKGIFYPRESRALNRAVIVLGEMIKELNS